jgi:pimeloyl-ACP methyl ester carboxylesterase
MVRRLRALLAVAAGGLLTGYAVLVLQNQRAASQAERDFPPLGEFIEVDGVRLHYLSRGSGPAVVLLHGNPGSVEDWALVMPALDTHRVIAFDRPGHGYSDAAPEDSGSPEVQADLLHRALVSLGVERPILVGHSWGGGLILVYTLHHPDEVAGLVAVEPTPYAEPTFSDPIFPILAAPILGELVAAAFTSPLGRPKVRDKLAIAFSPDPIPEPYLARAEAMWTRPGEGRATAIDSIRRKEVLATVAARYRELRAPLIILAADRDRLTDPQAHAHRLHAEVTTSTLTVLENAGHQLPETRPEAIVAAIRSLR